MENNQPCGNGGGAFLAGAAVVGIGALIHNVAKDESHKQELQQVFWYGIRQGRGQMAQEISAKDGEIHRLAGLLRQKDVELAKRDADIVRLNTVVGDQAKALAWQQLQLTAPLWSKDSDGNGSGQLN